MQKILENLAATAELMGQAISPTALAIMASDLAAYPEDVILKALAQVRLESKFKMTLAAVVEQIKKLSPDGRPGDDEAWAMMPRDEHTSVVMTNEMAEALGIAQSLLDSGDDVGARMAFKSAYNRIVEANSRIGKAPEWFASLGWDKNGREQVLLDAVEKGRLTAQHVAVLLPGTELGKWLENGQQTGVVAL